MTGSPCCILASVSVGDRRIVGEDTRHRRQVADVAVDDAEQVDDRLLVRGDAVEVAHGSRLGVSRCSRVNGPQDTK